MKDLTVEQQVVQDYLKANNEEFWNGLDMAGLLQTEMENLNIFDPEDRYGACRYTLEWAKLRLADTQNVSQEELNNAVTDCTEMGREQLLRRIEPYKWLPEICVEFKKTNTALFELAKREYCSGGTDGTGDAESAGSVEEAERLYRELLGYRDVLERETYLYRDKETVMEMCDAELSECELDLETVKGERLICSLRLGAYLRELEETGAESGFEDLAEFDPLTLGDDFFNGPTQEDPDE